MVCVLFCALGYVEVIFDDVSVLHDVFLAFRAYLSFFLCGGDGAELDQRRPIHYVRADKSLFEIGMDFSRRLGSLSAFDDRPGPRFLFARREIGDKPQKGVGFFNQAVESAFPKPNSSLNTCLVVRLHLRKLLFRLCCR